MRPKAIDLFSGAGGLSLGFEQAGFDIAAAVELDPIHAAIHEYNFAYGKTLCADVKALSGEALAGAAGLAVGELDVLFGGPPCQGFSLMGHRVLDDPRNALVFQFVRLVAEAMPKFAVMENVPGMAIGFGILEDLRHRLSEAGYQVAWPVEVLNAADFGVPQNRRRVFILAARADQKMPGYPARSVVTPKPGGQPRLLDQLPEGPTVACALSDLPRVEEFPRLTTTDELEVSLEGGCEYAQRLRGDLEDPSDFSRRRDVASGRLTGCRTAVHIDRSRERFAATLPGSTEPVSRFFRLPLGGLSNTLRAGTASDRGAFTAPRPIHPTAPRCITVREAARLHSYPDWFRFHPTIWHGFRQIGNSVPPLLGRAVGESVMAALGITAEKPAETVPMGRPALPFFDMGEASSFFGVSRHVVPQRTRRRAVEAS